MAIDGFFIKHLIAELKDNLSNLRVLRITQIKKDIFVFHFNKKGKKLFLNMKVNSPYSSVFLTNYLKGTGETFNTGLILNLKRLFEASILTNITQHLNDRVIIFEFTINDFLDGQIKRHIIFEIMGRYNNLIVTEDNIIIDAYNKAFNEKSRSIIPKAEFSFFPSNKSLLNTINYDEIDSPNYLSKNYMGFSTLLSKYLYDNHIDLNNILVKPTLNKTKNQFYWFNLFSKDDDTSYFNSLSDLFNKLVFEPTYDYTKQNNFIEKEIIRLTKRLDNLENDLNNAKNNLKLKDVGNLIYSSGKNLNEKHTAITDFNNEIITLDGNYTLKENAANAFKKYEKAHRAINYINENIKTTQENIDELLNIKFHLSLDNVNINEINDDLRRFGFKTKQVRRSIKKDQIQLFKVTYLNTLIYVGKNNCQNDYITHTIGSHNDCWLHVENAPGSHVLIKDSNPKDEVLEFAAMLAAKYSTLSLNRKANVNYTKVRNLKKIPNKPGHMVIMKSYNTLTVTIDHELINCVTKANKLK